MKTVLCVLVLSVCSELLGRSPLPIEPPSIGTPTGSFCALLVPNAQESARWYRDYLGFSVTRSAEGPNGASRTIVVEQKGVLLEIIEARDSFALQRVTRRRANRLQGIRKFGIVVDGKDFEALHRSLAEKEATFIGDVFTDDGLKMKSFIVRDNNGNLVQFFYRIES
jgi:catechol 2,3-dioxygenase-like lactoylglutathione lyase family enzyme